MQKMDISSLEDTKVEVVTKDDGTPALEMTLDDKSLKYIDSVRFYLATLNDKMTLQFSVTILICFRTGITVSSGIISTVTGRL